MQARCSCSGRLLNHLPISKEFAMKRLSTIFAASAFVLCGTVYAGGQAIPASAGSAQAAPAPAPDQDTAIGWSVKKSLLGKMVYNEKDEKIGPITDLLIGPDSTISHVVVAAGGYVGQGQHDVAIETGALEVKDGKFYVEGATRENVK